MRPHPKFIGWDVQHNPAPRALLQDEWDAYPLYLRRTLFGNLKLQRDAPVSLWYGSREELQAKMDSYEAKAGKAGNPPEADQSEIVLRG